MAALLSDDLRLVERQRGDPELLRMERMSLSIGRRLGTAQSERLFATETTTPSLAREPLCFEGALTGLVTAHEAGWLLAAAPTVFHAGGSKARGMGALQLTLPEFAWWQDGVWAPVAELAALVKEALSHATN